MSPPPPHLGVDLAPFLAPERVLVVPNRLSKGAILARLIERTASHPWVTDPASFTKAIYDREEVTSTGIGHEVAIPHARLTSIGGFVLSLGLFPTGIDFQSQDGRPVRIAVMMAATDQDRKVYLMVLASIASRLKVPGIVDRLVEARADPLAVLAAFRG